jgi:hypothetical protein
MPSIGATGYIFSENPALNQNSPTRFSHFLYWKTLIRDNSGEDAMYAGI